MARVPEKLASVIERILTSDSPVLVEGKRDAEAILAVGVKSDRIFVTAFRPMADILKMIRRRGADEIIELLDADAAGIKRARELYAASGDFKVNRELKKVLLTQINSKRIEDLLNFLEKS